MIAIPPDPGAIRAGARTVGVGNMPAAHHRASDCDRPVIGRRNRRLATGWRRPDHDGTVERDRGGAAVAADALRFRGTLATHDLEPLARAPAAYVEGLHVVISPIETEDSIRASCVLARESHQDGIPAAVS
jgi:hypothetical protein